MGLVLVGPPTVWVLVLLLPLGNLIIGAVAVLAEVETEVAVAIFVIFLASAHYPIYLLAIRSVSERVERRAVQYVLVVVCRRAV